MFEAVILAGGEGTRLKSVTGNLPKPMVSIGGKPFLYKLMQRLEEQGCSKIILSLCYQAEYVIQRVNIDKPVSIKVEFVVEKKPLGTGGAIKLAAKEISSDKFLVLNGDTFLDVDYCSVLECSNATDLLICGVDVKEASRYGTLSIDSDFKVLAMNEKGVAGPGVINSGAYVISTSDIISFEKDSFSFENEYVQAFNGNFKAYISNGYFIDIGIPDDYHKACQDIK